MAAWLPRGVFSTQRTHPADSEKDSIPDSKIPVANMGPTWVLPAPDGPHVGRMNLAIRVHVLPVC